MINNEFTLLLIQNCVVVFFWVGGGYSSK